MTAAAFPRIWYFDPNRRRYPEGGSHYSGSPIWREHWREVEVVGETSRSWVLRDGRKVPKKLPAGRPDYPFVFSEEEIDEREWMHVHRYKLFRQVETCADPRTLRKIAELIGYTA